MDKNVATESLKSKVKVTDWLELKDFMFVAVYMTVMLIFQTFVHRRLILWFYAFSFFIAVFLVLKSNFNARRRNYESIFFLLTRDDKVYKPITRGRNEK